MSGPPQTAQRGAAAAAGLAKGKSQAMQPWPYTEGCVPCPGTDKKAVRTDIKRIANDPSVWKRDSSGNIISRVTGADGWEPHPAFDDRVFLVRPVQLQMANGTWVNAIQSLSRMLTITGSNVPDHHFDTNCHGVTFTNGAYYLYDEEMGPLLAAGGPFMRTTTPKVGDFGVIMGYRNGKVVPVHTVTVTKVDPKTHEVTEVSGLGGLEMHEHRNPPGKCWKGDVMFVIDYYTLKPPPKPPPKPPAKKK